MSDRDPDTTVGRSLRQLPWLLLGGSVLVLVARLAIGGSDVPVWGFLLTVVVTLAVIALWTRRLDRQTASTAQLLGAAFACSTTLQYRLLRQVPRFRPLLQPVRFASLVGGWFLGKLIVTEETVTYMPNSWTRSFFRVPTIELRWSEIEHVAAIDQPGPRDPGILELRLADGAEIAFMVNRRKQLAEVLRRLRPGEGAA